MIGEVRIHHEPGADPNTGVQEIRPVCVNCDGPKNVTGALRTLRTRLRHREVPQPLVSDLEAVLAALEWHHG